MLAESVRSCMWMLFPSSERGALGRSFFYLDSLVAPSLYIKATRQGSLGKSSNRQSNQVVSYPTNQLLLGVLFIFVPVAPRQQPFLVLYYFINRKKKRRSTHLHRNLYPETPY